MPPNAIAADLPGPRPSSPDSEDVEKLTKARPLGRLPGSPPMLGIPDQRADEEDDGDAVRVAREVTLSARSLAPLAPASSLVSTVEAGPDPPAETVLSEAARVAQRRRLVPLVAVATAIIFLIFIAAMILSRSSGTTPMRLPTRSSSRTVLLSHV